MSARRKRQQPARATRRDYFARELQSVAAMLDRAVALVIETRADDDLEAFVSVLLTIRNARVLVAGLAAELGVNGGAA
jgi:hypothetical protein